MTVRRSTALPLSALLSHVIIAISRDYLDPGNGLPSLAVLFNVLRVVGDEGTAYRDIASRAAVSNRVVRIAARHLERHGWLVVEPATASDPKRIRLTPAARQARTAGWARLKSTERDWAIRYGETRLEKLRDALEAVVSQVDVELPHYPTSYGSGDISMTGGRYVAADPGPPRIPAHGQDWPVVLREDREAVFELPLTALVSQTLTAFTIDYDEDAETQSGGLQGVVTFLRFVGGDGIPLGEAAEIGDVSGSGRSTLERHDLVTVEPRTTRNALRRVTLTPRGKRARDRYPALAFDVERRWRSRFGPGPINGLRESLEALDDELDGDLPDFPDTNGWLRKLS